MLKQRHISTLKQRHISTLIHFNKVECLFNVEVRHCFNFYLVAWKLLKLTMKKSMFKKRIAVIIYCLINYGSYHHK